MATSQVETVNTGADKAKQGRVIFRWDDGRALPPRGRFVPPTMIALDRASDLQEEVFGPVLHVVRWRADELDVGAATAVLLYEILQQRSGA